MTTKTILVTCGTCRHPQRVPVSHVAEVDSDTIIPECLVLTLKPRRWIKDTYGDGQWHGNVVADRADLARLLFPRPDARQNGRGEEDTTMTTLSTGRVVREYVMLNGSTFADIDGAEMTADEWMEYAAHIRGLSDEEQRARLAAREHGLR